MTCISTNMPDWNHRKQIWSHWMACTLSKCSDKHYASLNFSQGLIYYWDVWMRSSRVWMRSSRVWMRSSRVWMRSSRVWMRSSRLWMRSSRVVRASDSQCRMVSTVLDSISPASSDTVESEGRQMKQCWISYMKKKKSKKSLFWFIIYFCSPVS